MNTRLLATGGIVALSVAFAVSLAGQTAPQPERTAAQAARPQSATPPAPVITRSAAASTAAPDAATQRALIDKYCVTCHNARTKTANLLLDELDVT